MKKLTCKADEFQCVSDLSCTPISNVCTGIKTCSDNSDEQVQFCNAFRWEVLKRTCFVAKPKASPHHHPTTTHNSIQVYTSHTPTYDTLFIKEGYEVNTYYKAKICLLYQTRWRTYLKEVWRSQEFFWFMPQLPPVFSKPSHIFRSLRVFTKTSWRNM